MVEHGMLENDGYEPVKSPIPALNRVFLVREQNDRGVEGRGPFLPKVIFDEPELAVEYVCKKLKIDVADAPQPNANGGYHFSQGFSIDVHPVISRQIINSQGDISEELERAEQELKSLQLYMAALKGAKVD